MFETVLLTSDMLVKLVWSECDGKHLTLVLTEHLFYFL